MSSDKYRALVESSSDFIWEMDSRGVYTYCSPQMETLWGHKPADMVGKSAFEMMPEEARSKGRAMLARMARNPEPFTRLESPALDSHGNIVHLEISGVPFFDEGGTLLGYRGVSRDVTQRVRVQEAMRASLDRVIELAKREETLKRITEESSALLPPSELAAKIAGAVAMLFGAKQAQIRLVSEDRRTLLGGGAYDPGGYLQGIGDMSVDAGTETAETFRTGIPRIGGDIDASLHAQSKVNAEAAGIRSFVLMPVRVGEQVIGVFYMGWAEPRKFADEDLSFIQAVTAQFSIGLQNARLYAGQRRRRHRIEAIHGVLEAGASSLDVHQAAQRALESLVEHRDVEMASVWLRDGDVVLLAGQVGYPPEYDRPVSLSASFDVNRVLKTGQRIIERYPRNQAVLDLYAKMGMELGSYVALPLALRNRTFGVLALAWHQTEDLSEYDLRFFDSVADEIAIVLENARLFEGERNLAETLQETLVVLPTRVPGVAFSRAYQSATHEIGHVGGDFVDVFEVQTGTVGISLGDVSGKGIEAAVTTSLIRNTLRVHALDGLTVDRIVAKANAVMHRFVEPDSFITLWFGLLDTRNGELRYTAAGHPPALVLAPSGRVVPLDCTDPFIGAFADVQFQAYPALLAPGDRLVLYSDGVIEARSPKGKLFGEARFRDLVSQQASAPTDSIAATIMQAVIEFSDGVLRDDAAVLVVEWPGRTPDASASSDASG